MAVIPPASKSHVSTTLGANEYASLSGRDTLARLYAARFPQTELAEKSAVWQMLCRHFFQRYVGANATVLDLGAGYCEFLTHIQCGRRIAVDLNPDVVEFAPPDTVIVHRSSHQLGDAVEDGSVDVVFCSNFFEHLPDKATFLATLAEVVRILRPGGRLLVLQPNIRAVGGAYWDFIDHQLPLTDRSLAEACEYAGLHVVEVVPRFLPYTTRSRLPQSPWLVRLYLRVPLAWRVLGGQAWVVAVKPGGRAS